MKPQIVKLGYSENRFDSMLDIALDYMSNVNPELNASWNKIQDIVNLWMGDFKLSFDRFRERSEWHYVILLGTDVNKPPQEYLIDILGMYDYKLNYYKSMRLQLLYKKDYKYSFNYDIYIYEVIS